MTKRHDAHLKIDETLWQRVVLVAKRDGQSYVSVIESALEQHLEQVAPRPPLRRRRKN